MRQNMLDFNTSEIPNLSNPDWGGMRVVEHEHGYVVFVDGGAGELDDSIPDWFRTIHKTALDTRSMIVNFDRDSSGTVADFTRSSDDALSPEGEVILDENIKEFLQYLHDFCKERSFNFASFDQSHLALLIAAWLDSFEHHRFKASDVSEEAPDDDLTHSIRKITAELLKAVEDDTFSTFEFKGAMSKLTEIFPMLWD